MPKRRAFIAHLVAGLAAALLPIATPAADRPVERVVLQVSDGNPATWNQALNVADNIRSAYGPGTKVELVAFGQGIQMLKFDAPVSSRLADAAKSGVAIYACETSMAKNKLARSDMAPDLIYVEAGVAQIITRQREGWAVIRP
jgi:hypothetical protein